MATLGIVDATVGVETFRAQDGGCLGYLVVDEASRAAWAIDPRLDQVAMDMWEPYVQSTRAHLPEADAKIVFDKFHVVKHLHEAVDRVRRGEHRTLKRDGDERLTGSKYLWLRRPADLLPEQRLVLRALQREDFKVGRAWALKERFRTF